MPNSRRTRSTFAGWRAACSRAIHNIGQDISYATRLFHRSPGFAATVVLSLGIGIGANTAIFSVVNALVLRPLPYRDPDRLMILWNRSPGLDITRDWFSTAQYFDIKREHRGFEAVAIALGLDANLNGGEGPERVGTIQASSNFLPMLGAKAALGRLFESGEDAPGSGRSAVITYGMWARRFGSDPGILGTSLMLNGLPLTIIGVLPRSFDLPREVFPTLYAIEPVEIFLALPLNSGAPENRAGEDFNILGKLKPGVTREQAQAEMDGITAALRRRYPNFYPAEGGLKFSIVPLLEQAVGDVRRPLYILFGAVGLLLLVACANVANLSLARAVARHKEIALRMALGASRPRILRQLLAESLFLALAGGACGVFLATWSLEGIRFLGAESVPRQSGIHIDGLVLAFTLVASCVTGILFGLIPALRVSRIELIPALKETGRHSTGTGAIWGSGHGIRKLLAVVELALSVVLLVGAGLLVLSFERLQNVDPGFNPRHLLTFGFSVSNAKYADSQKVLTTCGRLWNRLRRIPGVVGAGGVGPLPLTQIYAWNEVTIENRTPSPGVKFIADERVVAGGYFQAMEIPLLAGRFFDDRDTSKSLGVTIVNDRMAREFWPGKDPIGKHIRRGGADSGSPWLTVVGVVGSVKQNALDSVPQAAFYLPHSQFTARSLSVVVRSLTGLQALVPAIKEAVLELDPDLPVYRVQTMEEVVDRTLAQRRFSMSLLGIFAAIALALAAIGIYGVMAYMVSQGKREVGIRLAMGATRTCILRRIVREGMGLAILGAGIGVAGSLAFARIMQSLLFDTTATDALIFAAVPVLLLAIAFFACYLPARRASRVDPMASLRCE